MLAFKFSIWNSLFQVIFALLQAWFGLRPLRFWNDFIAVEAIACKQPMECACLPLCASLVGFFGVLLCLCLPGCLVAWLVCLLAACLAGWLGLLARLLACLLAGCLAAWLGAWLVGLLLGCLAGRLLASIAASLCIFLNDSGSVCLGCLCAYAWATNLAVEIWIWDFRDFKHEKVEGRALVNLEISALGCRSACCVSCKCVAVCRLSWIFNFIFFFKIFFGAFVGAPTGSPNI